jgi:hypothetical protein
MFESRNRLFWPAMAAFAGVVLGGCEASNDGPASPPPLTEVATANFNTTTGFLPHPIDLFFAPSAAAPVPDGTLNLPALPWRAPAMQTALNSLDGWSTTASLDTSFSLPLDATSISGSTVKIVKLWLNPSTKAPANPADPTQAALFLPAGAQSPVAGILSYGADYTADVSPDVDSGGKRLRITPLKPFDFSTGPAVNTGDNAGKVLNVGYLVILTNGLKATSGVAVTPDTQYADIKAAPADCSTFTNATQKAVCQLFKAHLGIAQATGTNPADVVLSWGFSTQSVDDVLTVVSQLSTATQTLVVPTGLNTNQANAGLAGKADIYVGSTKLPYYMKPAADPADRSVLTTFWTAATGPNPAFGLDANSRNLTMFNPVPAKVADVTVPLLVTVPNANSACTGKPANGWPVAIVQHGITRNRSDALAIADAFADACFVVAAIDLPLHGITDTTNPLYCDPTKPQCIGATERTFNLDIVNNTSGAATADGVIDGSGTHFINIPSPLTSRDNLRQGQADLITLTKSIQTLAVAVPAPAALGIDPTRVHFVGQSLGGIAGAGYLHFTDATRTATLEEPGGVLTRLLLDSQSFGPRIRAGVSAQLIVDSYNYNLFFRDFQAVADASDPINHIEASAAKVPVHLIKVLNDAVVPNSATDRLILAGGLVKLKTLGPNAVGAGTGAYVFFNKGAHGSMFDPTSSLAATIEMQRQAVLFAATANEPGGPFVFLTDPTVLDLN